MKYYQASGLYKNKIKFFLLPTLFILFFCFNVKSQNIIKQPEIKVNWISIEKAEELHKKNPKPWIIDVYTDWCGWCKTMDKNTFSNPNIASYINNFFYAVKYNAETLDTIKFRGKAYVNEQSKQKDAAGNPVRRPTHSLAIELLKGRMSYPTIVYIDTAWNISPVPGYVDVKGIEPILVYFAESINRTASFDVYKNYFSQTFPDPNDTVKPKELPEIIKWENFNSAIIKSREKDKKILIYITSKWNTGGKIMEKTTVNNNVIAKILNEDFIPVKIEAETLDTLKIDNQIFINENKMQNYPHQLVIGLLNQKLIYPSIVILDSKIQLIDRLNGYLTPQQIEPIVKFFAKDSYKTIKYTEFIKNFNYEIKDTPNTK